MHGNVGQVLVQVSKILCMTIYSHACSCTVAYSFRTVLSLYVVKCTKLHVKVIIGMQVHHFSWHEVQKSTVKQQQLCM